MRKKRDEDYEMCKIADKNYFPTKFNKMLNYLFLKSKHNEMMSSVSNPKDSKKTETNKDINRFLQAFTQSEDILKITE